MNADDLSYSGIAKQVQHDEGKGAELINICANELEDLRIEMNHLETRISRIKAREHQLLCGSRSVAQHLNKELPLAILRQGYIIVLTEGSMTIERNVI